MGFGGHNLHPIMDYKNDMIWISDGILKSVSLGFDDVDRDGSNTRSTDHYNIVDHYLISFDNLQSEVTHYGDKRILHSHTESDVVDPTFHLSLINEKQPAHLNYYHDGELIGQITLYASDLENIKMIEIPSEHRDYENINSVIHIIT